MAASSARSSTEIVSFVRGYHDYKDVWSPHIGDFLFLKREPSNQKDTMAVSIVKQDDGGENMVVGHMPRTLAPVVFYFLSKSFNSGTVEIKGQPASESWCRNGGGSSM